MFPDVPLQAITLDLADTHSVSLTVERILTEAIFIPEQPPPRPPQHSDSELSSSDEAEPTAEEHTPTLKHPAAGESERIATSEPLLLSRDLSEPRKEGGGGRGGEEEEGVSGEDASQSVGAIALSDDGFGDGAIPQTVARVTITDSDSLSPQLRHRRLDGSSSTSEGGVAVLAKQARSPDYPASACEAAEPQSLPLSSPSQRCSNGRRTLWSVPVSEWLRPPAPPPPHLFPFCSTGGTFSSTG